MKECGNGIVQRLHDFWFGGLYKTLVLNCYHRFGFRVKGSG